MRLSVVIPAYNEETYLAACLQSICEQQEPAYEIIVVDNNSTDKTAEIAASFPGVRVVKEARQGITHARNAGYNAATGDIIVRTDADTRVPRDWLSRIRQRFALGDLDALTGPSTSYDFPFMSLVVVNLYFGFAKVLQRGQDVLMGYNMALTREIWENVRDKVTLDDRLVHEDVDLAHHVAAAGGRIIRDPSIIVSTSGRRLMHKPGSFLVEYPLRFMKTYALNNNRHVLHKFLSAPEKLFEQKKKAVEVVNVREPR